MVQCSRKEEAQKKKLVIKPLRSRVAVQKDYTEESWNMLKEAIHAIEVEKPVSSSLEQLYRRVEDVCMQGGAGVLYEKLQKELDAHAVKVLMNMSAGVGLAADVFLESIEKTWNTYCSQLILIRQIFLYLDRTHVLISSEHRSVFDMGLWYFREYVVRDYIAVETKEIDGMLGIIDAERRGESVNRNLLKTLVRMLSLLGLYQISFVQQFLERSKEFYCEEAKKVIVEKSLEEYLVYVEERLHEEYDRCDACLETMTTMPLIQHVEGCLIEPHVGHMLEHGFEALLDQDKITDLKRMYAIFGRVSAHRAMCASFKQYLRKVGGNLVGNEEKDKEMISNVILLKSRMDKIVQECFGNDISFQDALKDGTRNDM